MPEMAVVSAKDLIFSDFFIIDILSLGILFIMVCFNVIFTLCN